MGRSVLDVSPAEGLREAAGAPVLNVVLDAPADDRDDVVDGGQRLVLGKDAALVLVKLFGGVDAAADGPASKDLRLHRVRPVQPPVLGHNLPPKSNFNQGRYCASSQAFVESLFLGICYLWGSAPQTIINADHVYSSTCNN